MSTTLQYQVRFGTMAPTALVTPTVWQRLWAAIERHGQRRAAAELRRIAAHHVFSDPEMTRHLLAAAVQAERA